MKEYYFSANNYEGCGHRHKTIKAASKCLPKIEDEKGKDVWKAKPTEPGNKDKPFSAKPTGFHAQCADGCNKAEFLIINGEDRTYYCSISAEAEIFEMVTDNDTITFHCSDKDKRGIQTIEIS